MSLIDANGRPMSAQREQALLIDCLAILDCHIAKEAALPLDEADLEHYAERVEQRDLLTRELADLLSAAEAEERESAPW